MAELLRKIKLYGFVGDCPDKNLCNNVAISLYQENDVQIDIHVVDFELNKIDTLPNPDDISWTLYDRDDGSQVLRYTYSDSEVTVSDNIISIRLHDTAISGLLGSYYMECNLLIGGFRFTLFTGTATVCETNINLSVPV